MLRSILIGLVAGQRAMTPLAVVAGAARRGTLPEGAEAPAFLSNPVVAAGAVALAAGEMAGDKMPSAPDRIIVPGLIGRAATAAFAGGVLAPVGQRKTGAALAAVTAVAASYIGFTLRVRSMKHSSQATTGFVEDALVLGSGWAIANR